MMILGALVTTSFWQCPEEDRFDQDQGRNTPDIAQKEQFSVISGPQLSKIVSSFVGQVPNNQKVETVSCEILRVTVVTTKGSFPMSFVAMRN
jgi:hypothetical protein